MDSHAVIIDPCKIRVADKVTFSYQGRDVIGIVAKKGRTYARSVRNITFVASIPPLSNLSLLDCYRGTKLPCTHPQLTVRRSFVYDNCRCYLTLQEGKPCTEDFAGFSSV